MLPTIQIQARILWLFSLLLGIGIALLFYYSDGLQGGMDSYNHFLIAKSSLQHPELLLDYWGKPVYNLIAAPFTQLGLWGSVLLNFISLVLSAYLVFQIARKLGSKIPLLAAILCLFSPVFLDNTISSLTEPLNAVLLSWVIYLFVHDRTALAALLSGFLPFARSEGFVILAVIGAFLLFYKRDYRSVLLLFVGSLFFNTLGWVITGETFWVITENPYLKFELSGENICGKGSFIHYFRWGHVTFNLAVCLLLVLSGFYLYKDIRRKETNQWKVMMLGIFGLYFGVHSTIWGLGMMGSCGYIRVMTVIAPIAAILAGLAFERLVNNRQVQIQQLLLFILIGNALYAPIRYYRGYYPVPISQEQQEFTRAFEWLAASEYANSNWAYMYPYLSMIANRDHWNPEEHIELYNTSLPYMEKGTVIIWDAHFGHNEAQIPIESLLNSEEYRLLNTIEPEQPFETSGKHNFYIVLFEKLSPKK